MVVTPCRPGILGWVVDGRTFAALWAMVVWAVHFYGIVRVALPEALG